MTFPNEIYTTVVAANNLLMFCCTVCFLSVKAFSLIRETDKKSQFEMQILFCLFAKCATFQMQVVLRQKLANEKKVKNFN